MKKLIAYVVVLAMCVMGFAACGNETPAGDTTSDLVAAKNYVNAMYKESTVSTPTDYTVVGVVNIGGVTFDITWTADHESVKIVPGTDKMVTIDVDEANPEEVTYNLTATLKDAEGNTESVSFAHKVPAAIIIEEGMSYSEIVDLAYTLEDGLALEGTYRLCGTIVKIDTPYSADYKNISVTVKVEGNDKTVQFYRLKGEGVENLAVGDVITAEGTFKNYKGTIEFDAGCTLDYVHSVGGAAEEKIEMPTTVEGILDAAYALESGASLPEACTLTGVITSVDTAYSEQYGNVTVTIVVNNVTDKPIQCFRLKGTGADTIKVGDTITVTGTIINYGGKIEFNSGCTLDAVVAQ